jgi:hypothetical protein
MPAEEPAPGCLPAVLLGQPGHTAEEPAPAARSSSRWSLLGALPLHPARERRAADVGASSSCLFTQHATPGTPARRAAPRAPASERPRLRPVSSRVPPPPVSRSLPRAGRGSHPRAAATGSRYPPPPSTAPLCARCLSTARAARSRSHARCSGAMGRSWSDPSISAAAPGRPASSSAAAAST